MTHTASPTASVCAPARPEADRIGAAATVPRHTTRGRQSVIYIFTFVLAFCSIVYELLLGQALSAFFGNTVLRYSVTIGLYMLSMGIGSLIAEGRFVKHPVISLLRIEAFLTMLGGGSMLSLFIVNSLGAAPITFFLFAHGLIIAIGILSGFEIPLLMVLMSLETDGKKMSVLGVDYLGAFCGTVIFAFVFYPIVGLVPTAFVVALLNAMVGVALITQADKVRESEYNEYRALIGLQAVLVLTLGMFLSIAGRVNESLLATYLGS